MQVVSNSSPLIILYKCGQLTLLKNMFGQVLIPPSVYQEVVHHTKDLQQSRSIAACDFIKVYPIRGDELVLSHRLDQGESEAIMLAMTVQADYLLLDDKRAQKEAAQHGITFIPTFALLLKAAQKGLILDFEKLLTDLQQQEIFLNRDLNLAVQKFLTTH